MNKAIGNFEGVATANSNIALARSMYEGGVNHEELIEAYKEVYKVRVDTWRRNEYTIDAGKSMLLTNVKPIGGRGQGIF